MQIAQYAADNMDRHLRQSRYPGRGLVIGRASEDDGWVQVYWIMGRSAHSRNRRFVVDGVHLRTEPVDLSLVVDPSLIIYEAMIELPGVYLVSNGDQTRTVADYLQAGKTFDDALGTREREPDPPNYTPRISGMLDLTNPEPGIALNILKGNLCDPDQTDRFTYRPAPPPPGLGYCLTTYMGDGSPLPSFDREPLLLPCAGGPEQILEAYWGALDADNRISIAVKYIPDSGATSTLIAYNRYGDR